MHEYEAEVLRVVDADTLDLLVDVGFNITIKKRFRLRDVDAPETWRPTTEAERMHGKQATAEIKTLINGVKKVKVVTYKEDKYRRYVCDIIVNGIDLATYLKENDLVKRDFY